MPLLITSEAIASHLQTYIQDMPGAGSQKKAAILRLVHEIWDGIVVIDTSQDLVIVEEELPDTGILVHIAHKPFFAKR